jgi:hypothetical protein
MNESTSHYSFDDVMDALATVHRRELLVSLVMQRSQDEPSVFDVLSYSEAFADVSFTEMYHVHLPKLAEYGFIEWNRDTHEVTKGPNFDDISPLLELLNRHSDRLPDGWLEPATMSSQSSRIRR